MNTSFLIAWGLLWTFLLGVIAHQFQFEQVVIHVPVVFAAYCAARRRPFTAYLTVLVLAWFTAVMAGGGRGPIMLAYLLVCLLFVSTRSRLRTHTNLRLAGIVVAGCMLWSILFCILMGIAGKGGWWKVMVQISPLSAAATGLFAWFTNAILSRIDPEQRTQIGIDTRLRSH